MARLRTSQWQADLLDIFLFMSHKYLTLHFCLDAFVEVKFADLDTMRTPVCRKTLNPVWNEDFRFVILFSSRNLI